MKPFVSRLFIILSLSVVLGGCISLKPTKHPGERFTPLSGAARQARLAKIHRWSTSGAFSVQQKGKKPVLANYSWLQSGRNRYRIRIASALNLFRVIIFGRSHSVTLWKSAKKQVTAKTPEALLRKEMGWSLPIRNMFYWVRGMVGPTQKQERFDKYGHLIGLTQQGWKIKFSDYSTVKGFDLPGKLIMVHSGVRATIVMKRWRLLKVYTHFT